uniref:RING-type domain-containing protein n=1 Tax=Aureoumbra lagunensis TaxID=44058 RepID=A0A7S3JUA4_9STRA|mmetsp:Transcript_10890/g.16411  ORF Transcript_10890/g.16411 Transcript_10890/m.16411 type:complete len:369 (+) Transcript_10890:68-1174(+)
MSHDPYQRNPYEADQNSSCISDADVCRNMLLEFFEQVVGQRFVIRHLRSEKGKELNGKHCMVVSYDKINFFEMEPFDITEDMLRARFCVKLIDCNKYVRVKLSNLAQPGSFVDVPSRTRLDDDDLRGMLIESLTSREIVIASQDGREDIQRRIKYVKNILKKTSLEQFILPCGSTLLDENDLFSNESRIVKSMCMVRHACCGDNIADFRRFGEGFSGAGEICAICTCKVKQSEVVLGLPCLHVFHSDCLRPWLETYKNECPTCRLKLPPHTKNATSFAIPNPRQKIILRLTEWFLSGLCERCQICFMEKNRINYIQVPDPSNPQGPLIFVATEETHFSSCHISSTCLNNSSVQGKMSPGGVVSPNLHF